MSLPQQKHVLDIGNPFMRADARAAGITVKELVSSRYQKVFYNLYVRADVVLTPQVRARAALRLASLDSYASHHTAAELWDLPVPHDDQTHITVPEHGERLRRQGLKSHLGQVDARRTVRSGIPVSTPEQTFIDLAAVGVNLCRPWRRVAESQAGHNPNSDRGDSSSAVAVQERVATPLPGRMMAHPTVCRFLDCDRRQSRFEQRNGRLGACDRRRPV